MKCPIDGTPLVMTERTGVEIDYCPQCRGVWLDRGELDKIIERSAVSQPSRPEPRRDEDSDRGYRKKKRSSFLDDLFDF
jgi:Zn-finger nucleic acid-binding protein